MTCLLAPLTLLGLLALPAAHPAAANNATNKPTEPRSPSPQPCRVQQLTSSPGKYKLCLQTNVDLLFPAFNQSKTITANLNFITGLINGAMRRRQLDTAIAPTTAATLGGMRLRLLSVSQQKLRIKVLYPKMAGTPHVNKGKHKSVARSSHETSVTLEGPLAVTAGKATLAKITVESIDFSISEFSAAEDGGEETVSMSKTTVTEDIGIKLNDKVLAFVNLVFWLFQALEESSP